MLERAHRVPVEVMVSGRVVSLTRMAKPCRFGVVVDAIPRRDPPFMEVPMKRSCMAITLGALFLAACATTLPPMVKATDVRAIAGTYEGMMHEKGLTARPVRFVLNPDGSFEITVGYPSGFRTNGALKVEADGTLSYEYDKLVGRGTVHEGEGRRVLVFTQAKGETTFSVSKPLP
jgi:hypothetical protein